MGVSINGGTPLSHPKMIILVWLLGTTIFGNPHMELPGQFWFPSKIHTLAIPGWHSLHWAASHDASEKSVAVVLQACGHHKGTRAAYCCPNIQPKYCTWQQVNKLGPQQKKGRYKKISFMGFMVVVNTPSPHEALLRVNHCFPLVKPYSRGLRWGVGRPAINQAYQLERVLIC